MAERMLAMELLEAHCKPDYVDPDRLQVDWEYEYESDKALRRERNYQARRDLRFKERWGGHDT